MILFRNMCRVVSVKILFILSKLTLKQLPSYRDRVEKQLFLSQMIAL